MNEKVINALRTLYADKGLNTTELEELAKIIGQNLNADASEDDINNAVSGVSDYVSLMQKFGNRCTSEVEQKYKGYVKPNDDPSKPSKGNTPDNVITKEMIEEMLKTGIAEAIKPFQEAEKAKHLQSVLLSQAKLKGVPQKFISRYKLDDEKKAEELASQIEQDYAEERKEILSSLGIADIPSKGAGDADDEDDFAKRMQDAQKALAPADSNK